MNLSICLMLATLAIALQVRPACSHISWNHLKLHIAYYARKQISDCAMHEHAQISQITRRALNAIKSKSNCKFCWQSEYYCLIANLFLFYWSECTWKVKENSWCGKAEARGDALLEWHDKIDGCRRTSATRMHQNLRKLLIRMLPQPPKQK